MQNYIFLKTAGLHLGEVEEDLDGEGDDVHAGDAPVAAADECEDDVGGSALDQPLTALWGKPGGGLCACTHTHTHICNKTHAQGLSLM